MLSSVQGRPLSRSGEQETTCLLSCKRAASTQTHKLQLRWTFHSARLCHDDETHLCLGRSSPLACCSYYSCGHFWRLTCFALCLPLLAVVYLHSLPCLCFLPLHRPRRRCPWSSRRLCLSQGLWLYQFCHWQGFGRSHAAAWRHRQISYLGRS